MVTNYEVQAQNHQRVMNIEEGFMGMKYTDAPLNQGFCRRLINFDITNDGSSLKLRPAFVKDSTPLTTWTESDGEDSFVHHVGRINVQDYSDDMTTTLCRYTLVGQSHTADATAKAHGLPERTLDVATSKLVVSYNGNAVVASYMSTNTRSGLYMPLEPTVDSIHGMNITCASRNGVYASYDGNTYIPVFEQYTTTNGVVTYRVKMMYISCKFNASKTAIYWSLENITPREVTATQAVNYGYNMLKDNPYSFEVTQSSGNTLLLDGIVPYNNLGNLITTCKPGDLVTFKLAYRYPSAHASKHYAVAWDITDNNSENAETVSLQPLRKNQNTMYQDVTAGGEISISTNQTSYTSFTLTCYVYDRDVVREIEYTSAAMDAVSCQPLATMTVSFTYLTDDASTTSNLSSSNYSLCTAKGMCTWNGRIVLWGVNGATSTIFISDMNDPSYFPYPNNVEVFDSQVVKALPFKDTLLVFTEDALYQMANASDGAGFKTVIIQQGLKTEVGESSSILSIQNMLFFKNGNYYYMLVPGKYASNQYGELQLAPVSESVSEIFDYFPDFLTELYGTGVTTSIQDWWCYLEQNTFRIVYKIKIEGLTTQYQDIVFLYNTKTRGWSMYTYRTGPNRMVQWIPSATLGSTFLAPYGGDTHLEMWLVHSDPTATYDSVPSPVLDPQPIQCMLDTGYKNIDIMHDKKYRQVQFYVTTQDTVFTAYPTIYVDNRFIFNEDISYIDDDGVYIEMMENDVVEGHQQYVTDIIPEEQLNWVADRVCIPFCGRGRTARLVLNMAFGNSDFRPEIRNLTWVYRTKSGRGGRDGNSIE